MTGILLLSAAKGYAQKQKVRFPVWTFHEKNVDIYGVSLGIGSGDNPKNTRTNGLKIELIGAGIMFMSRSPIAENDSTFAAYMAAPLSETVNGLALAASGSYCECTVNGATLGLIMHIGEQCVEYPLSHS